MYYKNSLKEQPCFTAGLVLQQRFAANVTTELLLANNSINMKEELLFMYNKFISLSSLPEVLCTNKLKIAFCLSTLRNYNAFFDVPIAENALSETSSDAFSHFPISRPKEPFEP